MNYFLKKKTDAGTIEEIEVSIERWAWRVQYHDGRILEQFSDDGFFHQFQEIDQEHAVLFSLYKPEFPHRRVDILVPAGARIFHFYRNVILDAGTQEEKRYRSYVFGYKFKGEAHYEFILPNDAVVITNTPNVDLSKFIV